MDKKQWRRIAASVRDGIDPQSAEHCRHLDAFLASQVRPDRWVLVYDAMTGEVNLSDLIDTAGDPTARYAITRTPDRGHTLTLHPFGCPSEQHRYGYRQPIIDAPIVADANVGAVLVPALAFDRTGVRLGRGKGFYDRLLARLDSTVLRIGITGGYIVDELPAESFDVSMTHLATASGVWPVPVPGQLVVTPEP